jgi:hypothetical protein
MMLNYNKNFLELMFKKMNNIKKYFLASFHKWRQLIVMFMLLMKIELIQWQLVILYNSIKDSNLKAKDFVKDRWNFIVNKRESRRWIMLNYFMNLIDIFIIEIFIVDNLDNNECFSCSDVWCFIILSVQM